MEPTDTKIPKAAIVNTRTDSPSSAITEQPPLRGLSDLPMDAPVSSYRALVRRGRLGA